MFRKLFLALSGVFLVAAAPSTKGPELISASIVPPADVSADPSNRLILDLSNGGKVVILLRPDAAPKHVERIKTLVRRGFYNGLAFHRVIPGFMAQGGDPKNDGSGGSELPDLKAEFNTLPYLRGAVGAARTSEPDTANSQFFIVFAPNSDLTANYTLFGRVIEGMAAVDSIAPGEPPANPTTIVRASLGDGSGPPVAPAPPVVAETPADPLAPADPPAAAEAPAETPDEGSDTGS